MGAFLTGLLHTVPTALTVGVVAGAILATIAWMLWLYRVTDQHKEQDRKKREQKYSADILSSQEGQKALTGFHDWKTHFDSGRMEFIWEDGRIVYVCHSGECLIDIRPLSAE